MIAVFSVVPGSLGDRGGINPGDRIESVNGIAVRDVIDYQFLTAEETLELGIISKRGSRKRLQIAKKIDESLGIVFPPIPVRRCRNRCIFCFVDQMPTGCRKSLYVKDDDYRASFLFGNYITLGNLLEEDWDRIFSQRLSPLYLSVHTTDPDLRRFMLGNPKAPDIMTAIQRLADRGIRIHTQIVVCPSVNDGSHLLKSVKDLALFYPSVQSIAAVPVGLTEHRSGLFPLRKFRLAEARRIVKDLEKLGNAFRNKLGTRLVYPSDEFYLAAGRPVPQSVFYEDFPQIENGVGMIADFLHDARKVRFQKRVPRTKITIVTGRSFAPVLKKTLDRISVTGLTLKVIAAKNYFFGSTVTVSGLLTGADIIQSIRGKKLGDALIIPASCVRDEDGLFLDDQSFADIQRAANVPVRTVHRFSDLGIILKELQQDKKRRGGRQ